MAAKTANNRPRKAVISFGHQHSNSATTEILVNQCPWKAQGKIQNLYIKI